MSIDKERVAANDVVPSLANVASLHDVEEHHVWRYDPSDEEVVSIWRTMRASPALDAHRREPALYPGIDKSVEETIFARRIDQLAIEPQTVHLDGDQASGVSKPMRYC